MLSPENCHTRLELISARAHTHTLAHTGKCEQRESGINSFFAHRAGSLNMSVNKQRQGKLMRTVNKIKPTTVSLLVLHQESPSRFRCLNLKAENESSKPKVHFSFPASLSLQTH